jgi:hypothetical protein
MKLSVLPPQSWLVVSSQRSRGRSSNRIIFYMITILKHSSQGFDIKYEDKTAVDTKISTVPVSNLWHTGNPIFYKNIIA